MIIIVDYDTGNCGSILNIIRRLGFKAKTSNKCDEIITASKLILPGVGSFDTGMINLQKLNLIDTLNHMALVKRIPILGICLGAQLMTKSSEEGKQPGLSWFNAVTRKFCLEAIEGRWPLPNIGWRDVFSTQNTNNYLLSKFEETPRFYFVHSYYFCSLVDGLSCMRSFYGIEFDCALQKDNLFAVQFHPEKSHRFGFTLFQSFLDL